MCYPDFPFPDNVPTFMHHTTVYEYLVNYAKHFGLEKLINFKTKVSSVSPILPKDGILDDNSRFIKWNVQYENVESKAKVDEEFDGVVVCNG